MDAVFSPLAPNLGGRKNAEELRPSARSIGWCRQVSVAAHCSAPGTTPSPRQDFALNPQSPNPLGQNLEDRPGRLLVQRLVVVAALGRLNATGTAFFTRALCDKPQRLPPQLSDH